MVNPVKRTQKWGTVLVPCPVALVSVGDGTKANIITISWTANLSSRPPRIGISVVPKRHSYDLLQRFGNFVINIPSADQMDAVMICGTKSGKNINKFEATGFTPISSTKISSPMISECPLNIECKTWKVIEVGSHHLFIGDVVVVHIDEAVLDANGEPDLTKFAIPAYLPLVREFWAVNQFLRKWK